MIDDCIARYELVLPISAFRADTKWANRFIINSFVIFFPFCVCSRLHRFWFLFRMNVLESEAHAFIRIIFHKLVRSGLFRRFTSRFHFSFPANCIIVCRLWMDADEQWMWATTEIDEMRDDQFLKNVSEHECVRVNRKYCIRSGVVSLALVTIHLRFK